MVARLPDGSGRIVSNVVRTQWEKPSSRTAAWCRRLPRAPTSSASTFSSTRRCAKPTSTISDLDAVAATAGPGLIGGLIVGLVTGKAIALAAQIPFIAVHHLEAHALTVGLTEGLKPPYLLLLVSGGHTQLLIVRGVGDYERLGTTIDDALGEAFDKTAKLLGLGFPGGPAVEQAARTGDASRFDLPRPMLGRAEPHFSFAGLKTAVRRTAEQLAPLKPQDVADIAASFQEAVAQSVADRVRARDGHRDRASRSRAHPATSSWPAASPPTSGCAKACADSPEAPASPSTCRRRSCAATTRR